MWVCVAALLILLEMSSALDKASSIYWFLNEFVISIRAWQLIRFDIDVYQRRDWQITKLSNFVANTINIVNTQQNSKNNNLKNIFAKTLKCY